MINIALDGPAGAGKSWLAHTLAEKLGFIHVDTGALYRSIGLYMSRCGIAPEDKAAFVKALDGLTVELGFENGEQRVYLCGEDVTGLIRTPEISMYASAVSSVPEVRAFLLETQRRLARENNVIMDGRDIGTVVLPDAQVKIFLTAAPEIRAKRRYDELCAKGVQTTFDEVLSDLNKRDYDDSHRAAAPLKQAEDAVLADTSALDFEQSCELVCSIIREKL